jgi:hypothetical protein
MSTLDIFRIHLVIGLVAWGIFVALYWWPALDSMGRRPALRQIAMLHAFRFEGLVFLMPAFVGQGLPAAFAVPAAYGDFATSLLAIASILTYRWERIALFFTVLYTAVGATDLVANVYRAIALGIDHHTESFGVAYVIVVLYVPLLIITHALAVRLLLKPAAQPDATDFRTTSALAG